MAWRKKREGCPNRLKDSLTKKLSNSSMDKVMKGQLQKWKKFEEEAELRDSERERGNEKNGKRQ